MDPIAHMIADFLGTLDYPNRVIPKVRKPRKKWARKRPTQMTKYGATIDAMRKAGYQFKRISELLQITGATTVVFRYRQYLKEKEANDK